MYLAGSVHGQVRSYGKMAVAAAEFTTSARLDKVRGRIGLFTLLTALAAYTLTTLDDGNIAARIISSFVLFGSALYLAYPIRQPLSVNIPSVCLLLMACYGIAQTLWSPQKILYNGWSGVLFWFTAAAICLVSTQIFRDRLLSVQFRVFLVVFGSAVCLLDLLERASHTNKYFWIIPSKYATVNGSFAYWNNFAQFVELFLPITL